MFRLDENVNVEKILHNIKQLCDHAKAFKDRVYSGLAKDLEDADNYDASGCLFDVTEEFLKEHFSFHCIHVEWEDEVSVWGSWEDSGNQDYSIIYHCGTGEMEYDIL